MAVSASMGGATARAPMEKPEALNAPLFRSIVDKLEAGGRHVVLDLGPASTPMLDLLGQFRCRVEIVDFASDDGIGRMNAEAESADDLLARAETFLPPYRGEEDALDLVFCWDLPNYLTPAALTALMSAIAARTRPGALAHALIVYSERTMPERPGRFFPTPDLKLVDRGFAATEIKAPRYSPEDLGRIMGGFVIERGRLLADGKQEMLFRAPG
ncbi:MAG TPA: hypothetical protein VHG33_06985 [Woeseiaceae bacterium]|nr:hypothetical protein [Woeseiaceae bacterium]